MWRHFKDIANLERHLETPLSPPTFTQTSSCQHIKDEHVVSSMGLCILDMLALAAV